MILSKKRFFKNIFGFEEYSERTEEPDQQGVSVEMAILHYEKVRLLILLLSLLLLLCGFLSFLLTHTIFLLSTVILLVFFGYRCLDRYMCMLEHSSPSSRFITKVVR